MKKNIFVLLMFIIILTGCDAEYNLEFSNDSIKENTKITILDSDIPVEDPNQMIEVDDRITPFIEQDQYPFFNSEKVKYNKDVKKSGDITTINFDYEFTHKEYLDSYVYNSCFEKKNFSTEGDNHYLSFSGDFYCFYGDSITINIKTNNKVIENNADKVNGNIYTWVINKDNFNDVNIDMVISKDSAVVERVIIYIVIGISIVLFIAGFIVYKKIKNRDSVNEI